MQNYVVPEELPRFLENIEALADLAYGSNNIEIAEVAYTRLIDWYNDLGIDFEQPKQKLLMKLGGLYEATDQKDQAERRYYNIFENILNIDNNPGFHHAILNFGTKGRFNQDALMGIIRCCPLCRFQLRNAYLQTPLHLAVARQQEQVVVAILERLRDFRRQAIDPIYLDAIDYQQQTILAMAVQAPCSLSLVYTLVKYGADVNPGTRPGGPLTPLQAASYPGHERDDVAWVLLKHQANPKDVHPNSTIAAKLMVNALPEPAGYISLLSELDRPPDAQTMPGYDNENYDIR
jgi:ankyrin repeat protein